MGKDKDADGKGVLYCKYSVYCSINQKKKIIKLGASLLEFELL